MWKQEGNRSMSDEVQVKDNGSTVSLCREGHGIQGNHYLQRDRSHRWLTGWHTDGVLFEGEEAIITAKVTAGTIVCKENHKRYLCDGQNQAQSNGCIRGGVKTPLLSIEEACYSTARLKWLKAFETPNKRRRCVRSPHRPASACYISN